MKKENIEKIKKVLLYVFGGMVGILLFIILGALFLLLVIKVGGWVFSLFGF